MKNKPNKEHIIAQKDELISEFTSRYWMLMTFIFILYGAMWWKIWQNFDWLAKFFDTFKFSNSIINKYLIDNVEILISFGVVYFTTLAFWKFKKGLFNDSEYKIKFWSGILVHRLFSMVILSPFIIYLLNKTIPNGEYHIFWLIVAWLFYYLLPLFFSIWSKQRKKITDNKCVFLLICTIMIFIIYLCFYINGFWEPMIILFVSWIIFPSSDSLLRSYIVSIDNFNSIEKVHQISSEYTKSLKDWTVWSKITNFILAIETTEENPVSLPLAFESLEILWNMAIAWAFWIIALVWFYDANIITALYIHITLVVSALHLWLISNKFPNIIDIKADWEWYNWVFLLERSEDKILIMNKEGKILFKPDIVSEIRMPFKLIQKEEIINKKSPK
ncbi:MAG: hypothetical protein ACD_3C00086G0035 [uncultured bacterium (gcode 4)]|uniref:Transmembrane protein n=1 Tax=uncultured bacterium (gcode 4) TaxID=1234023 RepID=K2FAQ7_9BACT|nr:MAG: hypothetical protein ACD_3C00086G0035 [uncultured bacterium (gcode 4)]